MPQEGHTARQSPGSNWGSEPLIPEEEDPPSPRPHGLDIRGHELSAALTTLLPGPWGFEAGAPARPVPYTRCSQTSPDILSSVVPKAPGYDPCGHLSAGDSGKPAHIPGDLKASGGVPRLAGASPGPLPQALYFPHARQESSLAGEACFSSSQVALTPFLQNQLHCSHGFNTEVGKAVFLAGITLAPLCLPPSCREKQGVGGRLAVTWSPAPNHL